jgi:hypothetical protein
MPCQKSRNGGTGWVNKRRKAGMYREEEKLSEVKEKGMGKATILF